MILKKVKLRIYGIIWILNFNYPYYLCLIIFLSLFNFMYNHSIYLFILFTYKIILYSLKLYILHFWITKGFKFQIAKKKIVF